jgi:hypothetical protein
LFPLFKEKEMSQKLGFVVVRASKVVLRAEKEIERMKAERAEEARKFVQGVQEMLDQRLFSKWFKRPPVTPVQALKYIENNEFYRWEYAGLKPTYVSTRQESLQKLIDVGNDMLSVSPLFNMEIAIEVADWLVLKPE